MRTVEVLQVLGSLVGTFAAVLMGLEQKLLRQLKKQHAVSPESAIVLPSLSALSRWRYSILLRRGAVRHTAEGRVYFDAASYRMLSRRRVGIAIPAVLVALALVVLLYVMGK